MIYAVLEEALLDPFNFASLIEERRRECPHGVVTLTLAILAEKLFYSVRGLDAEIFGVLAAQVFRAVVALTHGGHVFFGGGELLLLDGIIRCRNGSRRLLGQSFDARASSTKAVLDFA